MNIRRKLLSLLCAAALVAGLSAPALAAGAGFTDVAASDWFYDDIIAVAEKDLMKGVTATKFDPQGTVTRGTVLTVLWRLEGSPETTVSAVFPDVPAKHWAYTAAAWAKGAGIATGYSNGTFGPGDSVTREQLAVFLWRYAVHKGDPIAEGVIDLYPDGSYINSWAVTGMKHALGAGLMTGTSVGLSPLGIATRSELATILVRLTTPVKG